MTEIDSIKLTPFQQKAYDAMRDGKNVFLTGPGGTGKSLLIRKFCEDFQDKKTIALTSTTGVSALQIGGTTVHSYLGIGIGEGTVEELIKRIKYNRKAKKHWYETKVLIVDEVSMLNPELFEKLNDIGKLMMYDNMFFIDDCKAPSFGGIQIVLSGDFLQLPPVFESGEEKKFIFEVPTWEECIKPENIFYFTEIHRQSGELMKKVLNDIRVEDITEDVEVFLRSRENVKLKIPHGIKPTVIYATNSEVDAQNERELNKFVEKGLDFHEYEMTVVVHDIVRNKQQLIDRWRKQCLAPNILQLCVGAQVMLLYNIDLDAGLVNGSRGIVTGFEDATFLPVIKFTNGIEIPIGFNTWDVKERKTKILTIKQIPLKLAWAVTVHKIQGATLDYAIVDFDRIFEKGQIYVALSRVRTAEGLSIRNLDFDKIKSNEKCIKFYKNLISNSPFKK